MKKLNHEPKMLTLEDLHIFGATICSFESYACAFTKATQLELDLIVAGNDYWKTLVARIQNCRCQRIVGSDKSCLNCMRTVNAQLQHAREVPEGTFVTCRCFGGMRFSVVLLSKKKGVGVYLIVGRVIVSEEIEGKGIGEDEPDRGGMAPNLDCLFEEVSEDFVTMSSESYTAGLSLLEFALPLLREQVGRQSFYRALALDSTVSEACRHLEAHFSEGELHLDDVAAHCGVSADWLTRHFRKSMHVTIPEYLTRLRVDHVSRLLETSGNSITEVCFESGFGSISQFNRAFHKLKGVSPREYRESL